MELELRKCLPTSSPNKILYPFPKHSQCVWGGVVCVYVLSTEKKKKNTM